MREFHAQSLLIIVGREPVGIGRDKAVDETPVKQRVAERLQACIRTCDTVGRLGGDEFALILTDLSAPHDAALVLL
mgnify:CR=1 FL=1